jgi:4-carboxymuconolactone decarboxylase
MDQNLFEKGMARRKATLGADYVENNLAAVESATNFC